MQKNKKKTTEKQSLFITNTNHDRPSERTEQISTVLSEDSPWVIREEYKKLRTNISFSMNLDEKKVIGITSSTQGEGKTVTAINLAISFAEIGKTVLLIDADMRLPSVAKRLEVPPKTEGLSDVLSAQAWFDDVVISNIRSGLSVLTSGEIPPDPTWMLQSQQAIGLFDELKKNYEVIIVDFPPVNTVTDACIASRYIDAYLLVVKPEITDRREVEKAIKNLRIADAYILGFVENNAIRKNNHYYYSEYYKDSKGSEGKRKKGRKHAG